MRGSLDFSQRTSSISRESPLRRNQRVPSFHRVKTGHWARRAQHRECAEATWDSPGPRPLCDGRHVRLACCPARMCSGQGPGTQNRQRSRQRQLPPGAAARRGHPCCWGASPRPSRDPPRQPGELARSLRAHCSLRLKLGEDTPPSVASRTGRPHHSLPFPQCRRPADRGEGHGVSRAWEPRPQTKPHSHREASSSPPTSAVLSEVGGRAEVRGATTPPPW